jgi:hypothetical protein
LIEVNVDLLTATYGYSGSNRGMSWAHLNLDQVKVLAAATVVKSPWKRGGHPSQGLGRGEDAEEN